MLNSEGKRREVCLATENFANTTAVHGIPHVFQHSNIFAKCFWISICLCGSGKIISDLFDFEIFSKKIIDSGTELFWLISTALNSR